jgi:uncharacterized protein
VTVVADTGALFALIDARDSWHGRVLEWWASNATPVIVPAVVLPELCWLLTTRISAVAETAFVRAVLDGEFTIEPLDAADTARAHALMTRYLDLPLGFVDAAVIATAERLHARAILTTDRRLFGVVTTRRKPRIALAP